MLTDRLFLGRSRTIMVSPMRYISIKKSSGMDSLTVKFPQTRPFVVFTMKIPHATRKVLVVIVSNNITYYLQINRPLLCHLLL